MKYKIFIIIGILLISSLSYCQNYKILGWLDSGGGLRNSQNFSLEDSSGNITTLDAKSTNYSLNSGYIFPYSLILPVSTTIPLSYKWMMFSLPLIPENKDVANLFPASGVDIYFWDPNAVDDPVFHKFRVPKQIFPGRAYWIRVPSEYNLNISGNTPDLNLPYLIKVFPGWNQIGNPFNFKVDWAKLKVKYNTEVMDLDTANSKGYFKNYFYFYDEGGYHQVIYPEGKLLPTYGIWVYSDVECDIAIPPSPTQNGSVYFKQKSKAPLDDYSYQIQIIAKCGEYNDYDNFIGTSPDASNGEDKYDVLEPPVFSDYVSVYFPEQNKKYANNFKSIDSNEKIWEMVVETNLKNKDVNLSFIPTSLPEGLKISLLDKKENKVINIKENNTYTYNSGRDIKREFLIVIGKYQAGDLSISKVYNYPNPARPIPDAEGKLSGASAATKFVYKATTGFITSAKIEIYNIRGKLIKTIIDETPNDGEYDWNFGNSLSNGVYIYKITVSDGVKNITKTGKLVVIK
jgi:hypothetical protein